MNLKDCKVTLMLNMHTGYVIGSVQEDILRDILKIVCPERNVTWEYQQEFTQSLQADGFDFTTAIWIPNFYVKVVGGYGTCFIATSIAELFRGCFENKIDVDI